MDDSISRQAALDCVTYDVEYTVECIKALPSALSERKRGKWIKCDVDWFKTMCKCSECGAMIDINEKYKNFFCYHCGADMRGEQDDK